MNNTIEWISLWTDKLDELFLHIGMSPDLSIFLRTFLFALVLTGLAFLVYIITEKVIISGIKRLASKTKTRLDDILVEQGVFHKIAHVTPALLIYGSADFVFKDYPVFDGLIEHASLIYLIIMVVLTIDSAINALHMMYLSMDISNGRSIKGYVQIVKILFYFIGIIFIISILIGESPKMLLTGLGAMAAILILVFKDTILGFVASIQLSGNNMVSPGDWIEMPSHNADGDVIDISLNTVKVRNWDKTITTIPTYALVSDSFKNWKGMEESGGRRIKRSIYIDMNTVRFVDAEMIEKLKKIKVLKDYIETKQEEIKEYNDRNHIDDEVAVNGRRMTNLGIFRVYVKEYLKNNPKVHQELTLMVRQLQPSEKGIPIEIYAFSNDQAWVNYEGIQADIFDHILAVIPEFGLRVFQAPSGIDFQQFSSR